MKRIMALTAAASLLALLALASPAAAQDGPTLSADPAAVDGPGTHSFTLTGSGWTAGLLVFVVPCTYSGDQLTTATPAEEMATVLGALGQDACVLAPMGSATVGADGTFTVEVTHDVPANFAFGAGDAASTESGAAPVLFIAEDMDDMAPEGAAETGFGGMAGSDGNSVAVPLAATLAALILFGGAALVARRNA